MKKYIFVLIPILFLGIIPEISGQTIDERLQSIENKIPQLQKQIDTSTNVSWEYYAAITAISVTGVAALVSIILTWKSNKDSKKVSEIDLMLRLSDRIYNSDVGKKIIEIVKDKDGIVVDINKKEGENNGSLAHRDVENFLNDVETVFLLKDQDVLTSKMAKQSFTWVIDLIIKNNNMMDFVTAKQIEFGDLAWKPISNYKIKKESKSNNSKSSDK